MASITSTGVGSGLDVESIVTQLMAVEKRPLALLQKEQTTLNAKISSFGKIQSQLSDLRDKASALSSTSLWKQTVATSADATAVGVTASTSATAGSYAVSVSSLASSQTLVSPALGSSSATLNEGSLTIELGTWSPTAAPGNAPASFTPKVPAASTTIVIGPGDTGLESIRDRINASNSSVTASIVTDANGARLSIRSKATGAENGIRIAATETVDDGAANTGLSALAYDPAGGSAAMTRTSAAANAKASINGIAVESASNTLTNVVDGLTIDLKRTTTSDVNLDVSADTDSVKKAIQDFATAFNSLAGFIQNETKYNADTKKGATLQGDRTAVGLQSQLRSLLNESFTGSSTFTRLSDIGLAMKSDGTLETNATKLDAALGNLTELKKVLSDSGSTTATKGFMTRYRDWADSLLGLDGALDSRTKGLAASVTRNNSRQDSLQTRLDDTETRLRKQYQTLDANMAKLSGLGNYVNQMITSINKSA